MFLQIRKRFRLAAAVAAVQQSDSESDLSDDKESSDEEDVPIVQDSNDDQSQSEESDAPDMDPPLRRRKITKSRPSC